MALTVEVAAADGGSLLTIRQDGYRDGPGWDWYHDAVRSAWPEVAKLVKRFVEAA